MQNLRDFTKLIASWRNVQGKCVHSKAELLCKIELLLKFSFQFSQFPLKIFFCVLVPHCALMEKNGRIDVSANGQKL